MNAATATEARNHSRDGVLVAVIAYLMWGFLPAYFKVTDHVTPLEMLAHRVVWSVPFGLLIILVRRQWSDVTAALSNRNMFLMLLLAAIAIAINWLIYIWAVFNSMIFQASLGYFINPLIYVLVGVTFYQEPFRIFQKLAVILASIGVVLLSVIGGEPPFIALALAVSFTIYGVIKKSLGIGGMPGLFIETLLLFLPALIYLLYLHSTGDLSFSFSAPGGALLLMLAGPFTVLPLLFFSLATRRLRLSTLGFLQFIGPTLQFALGVYYGEELTLPYKICFALIWMAVALYAFDAWNAGRRKGVNNPAVL